VPPPAAVSVEVVEAVDVVDVGVGDVREPVLPVVVLIEVESSPPQEPSASAARRSDAAATLTT
jgi:hypothetical protein